MATPDTTHRVLIRRVQPGDGPLLRDLTLQMLTDSPLAFGETLADAEARTAAGWAELADQLTSVATLCGFIAEDSVGVCGFVYGDAAFPQAPPATVVISRLWAAPRLRGTGLGRRLMDAVTVWASAVGAEQVALGVTEMNANAQQFYAHLGYIDTGMRLPWPPDPTKTIVVLARQLNA